MSVRHPWRIVVVNGYGCHVKPELAEYLDGVVQFVNEREPATLIPCGGATQGMSAPKCTEAALMAIYIRQRTPHVPEYIIEDKSYTTLENVQNAARHIRALPGINDHWPEVEVDVFCEAQRSLKTLILYWFLLPELRRHHHRVKVRTSSWELANPLKELTHLLFDLAALWVPGLAGYAHRKLVKKSATR